MICKILGLFVNTFTANDNYFLLIRDNLARPLEMQLSEKLQTAKDVVRKRSTKYRLRRGLKKRHGNWSQTLLKSEGHHIYHSYSSL